MKANYRKNGHTAWFQANTQTSHHYWEDLMIKSNWYVVCIVFFYAQRKNVWTLSNLFLFYVLSFKCMHIINILLYFLHIYPILKSVFFVLNICWGCIIVYIFAIISFLYCFLKEWNFVKPSQLSHKKTPNVYTEDYDIIVCWNRSLRHWELYYDNNSKNAILVYKRRISIHTSV